MKLGSGTFGDVYEEEDAKTGERMAVKYMRHFDEGDDGMSKEALREVDAYSRLRHPSLIRVERIEPRTHQGRNTLAIVMEKAEFTVFDWAVEATQLPHDRVDMAIHVFRVLLDFFAFLHPHNMLHRDIKPENILLVRRHGKLSPKLADLGALRWTGGGSILTGCIGTEAYRPPEMQGRRYGRPGEYYCLACVLVVILSGEVPQTRRNVSQPQDWVNHLRETAAKGPGDWIPNSLLCILYKMLDRVPSRRPGVKEITRDWNLWSSKTLNLNPGHLLVVSKASSPKIPVTLREEIFQWLKKNNAASRISSTTLDHAMHMFDDFVAENYATATKSYNTIRLYAIVCWYIAIKMFEVDYLSAPAYIDGNDYMGVDTIRAEMEVVQALHYVFLRRPVVVSSGSGCAFL